MRLPAVLSPGKGNSHNGEIEMSGDYQVVTILYT